MFEFKSLILYDRLTPEAQSRLIDRFVRLDPDRLAKLTALRSKLDKKKLEIRD